MKLLYLTPEYPHPRTGHSGGLGTSIRVLAGGLFALGHEVRVLVYNQSQEAVFEDEGIEVMTTRNVKMKGLSWWLTRRKLQSFIDRLHEEGKADLVEAADWTGITAFLRAKCPVVVRLHGSDTYFCHLEGRPVKWFNRFLEAKALRSADARVSVSRYTAEMTNRIFGFDHKYTILHNGVDTSAFQPARSQGRTLLYFGSLIRKKGLLELPIIFNEVVKSDPMARLVLAGKDVPDAQSGNPSTWAMMQERFSPEALQRVTWLGALPFSEVAAQIAGASVCVFPSFAEAFPVSWLEAMAMGKAIVASDIGWAPEVFEDGVHGFLADPTDHVRFASRILALFADAELMDTFGRAARQRAEEAFEVSLIARQNAVFYSRLLHDAPISEIHHRQG